MHSGAAVTIGVVLRLGSALIAQVARQVKDFLLGSLHGGQADGSPGLDVFLKGGGGRRRP